MSNIHKVLAAFGALTLILLSGVSEFGTLACPRRSLQTPDSSSALTPTPKGSEDVLWSLAIHCAEDLSSDSNCRSYTKDEKEQYVIVKDHDPNKPAAYLIIPLEPITGIEDDRIFSPSIIGLWESAWLWAEKYPGKSASQTALAINSIVGRSQNQLHIHISCVLPQVRETLAKTRIPTKASDAVALRLGPDHNVYWTVVVPDLRTSSPFRVIQSMPHVDKNDMKDQSILVVGSQESNQYYVLDTTANRNNPGHAEELLDQTCALK